MKHVPDPRVLRSPTGKKDGKGWCFYLKDKVACPKPTENDRESIKSKAQHINLLENLISMTTETEN